MDQWAKCLSCKHEKLNLVSNIHVKCLAVLIYTDNFNTGVEETGKSLNSLTGLKSTLSELQLCKKWYKISQIFLETWYLVLTSSLHMLAHICLCTCAETPTHKIVFVFLDITHFKNVIHLEINLWLFSVSKYKK